MFSEATCSQLIRNIPVVSIPPNTAMRYGQPGAMSADEALCKLETAALVELTLSFALSCGTEATVPSRNRQELAAVEERICD